MPSNYETYTVAELKEALRKVGFTASRGLRKAELVEKLEELAGKLPATT